MTGLMTAAPLPDDLGARTGPTLLAQPGPGSASGPFPWLAQSGVLLGGGYQESDFASGGYPVGEVVGGPGQVR